MLGISMLSTDTGGTEQAAETQSEERSWKHKYFEGKLPRP